MKVRDLMTPNPVTVRPTDTLSSVDEKMRAGRFRRVPVVDGTGALVGIVSDGDLRAHVGYFPTTCVTAAMAENVITIAPGASIGDAAGLMRWHKIGGLPVVDDGGHLVGIVTESDLLLALAESPSTGAAEPISSPRMGKE